MTQNKLTIVAFALVALTQGFGQQVHAQSLHGSRLTEGPLVIQPLQLSATSGVAPYKVRINGPHEITDKIQSWDGTIRRYYGAGFSVNWGDGKFTPNLDAANQNGSVAREHTYTVPGTYKITATIFHPGPTDGPVTDWQGTASVTITSRTATHDIPIQRSCFSKTSKRHSRSRTANCVCQSATKSTKQ